MGGQLNELGTARFAEVLKRTLGIDSNPAPALQPELVGAIVLEAERPEWLFLQNAKRCTGGGVQAASGAAISAHRLRNPANSGVLAVVEMIQVFAAASAPLGIIRPSTGAANKTNLLSAMPIDSRYGDYASGGLGVCSCITSSDNASNSLTIAGYFAPIQRTLDVPLNWVLAPGAGLDIETNVINVDWYVRWIWRERAIEPWEAK